MEAVPVAALVRELPLSPSRPLFKTGTVEGPRDELQLLLLLYVEIEPVYQSTFLEATGVPPDGANIADDLPTPFADAATGKLSRRV